MQSVQAVHKIIDDRGAWQPVQGDRNRARNLSVKWADNVRKARV